MTGPIRDPAWRRLLRNAGYLLGGRVLRDAMGLAALALAARELGPAAFGVLALVQSYAFTVNWLLNFQSWQALVRYGAGYDADAPAGRTALAGLLRLGLALDGATAIAGAAVGVAVAGAAGALWGWDEQTVRLARLYCAVILFDLTGTWTAALRLFDRFDLMALQALAAAAVKLAGVGWALLAHPSLAVFVLVWMAADLTGLTVAAALALSVAARRGVLRAPAPPLRQAAADHPGILRFFLTTNWHATVRTASKEADILVVGAVLGGAGVGLYAITKQVASLLSRAGDPLYQAVYPELARLWAAGERATFRRLLDRATGYGALAAALCCLAFALWGRPAMALALGDQYAVAHAAAVVYLAAAGIGLATFAFHPAALAMDRPGESFGVLAACTALYFALLVPLTHAWGLVGASAAYLAFYAAWAAALRWRLAVLLREAAR